MATYLSYHTFKRLSRVFQNFFWSFFSEAGINQVRFSPESRFPCGFCLTLSSLSRATALLYYHLSFSLSTPFFNLFSLSTNCILSPTLFPTSFQFCLRSVFFWCHFFLHHLLWKQLNAWFLTESGYSLSISEGSALRTTHSFSLSAESDQGLCPWILQAFEKAWAKLLCCRSWLDYQPRAAN